jgi:transposase
MFSLNLSMQYYLYGQVTDMRKGFDSLSGLVQSRMMRNPMSGEVFIFINRKRDLVKLLRWEPNGFILYYKRLEAGTFELPKMPAGSITRQIEWPELVMIIQGISLEGIHKRKRFGE